MEKLNIVGKRSGDGFVAHKGMLASAISRVLAERLMLLDFTIGRKGFLGYLKSLAGSNVVKVVPATDDASEELVKGKRLKVVCGSHTSYIEDEAWIGDNTPFTIAEVRVSPANTVSPNIGTIELSEALERVLPFTAKDGNRPVLACVLFQAKAGKLTLVSADGYRLAVANLDCEAGEGEALIDRQDLAGIANALRRARRARISIEAGDTPKLVIDTEAIRYEWQGIEGNFPNYEALIPAEAKTVAHFDTTEAIKAVNSLKALGSEKVYLIDLALGDGILALADKDGFGQSTIPASVEGEPVKIRLDGNYLSQALKACGGMVDFQMTSPSSPVLFTANGYRLVVMPLFAEPKDEPKAEADKPKAEAETVAKAQAVAEAEAIAKAKPKPKAKGRSHRKEPVAVS